MAHDDDVRPHGRDAGGDLGIWKPEEGVPADHGSQTPAAPRDPIPDPSDRNGRRRRRRSALRWKIALVVLVGALALAIDGVYTFVSLHSAMHDAAGRLASAQAAIADAELRAAAREVAAARTAVDDARGLRRHPSFLLASFVPDVDAVSHLTEALDSAVAAGEEAIDVAEALDLTEDGVAPAIYRDGTVDLALLRTTRPSMAKIVDRLEHALDEIDAAPSSRIGAIRDAIVEGRSRVSDALDIAAAGDALAQALPAALGGEGTRRYLLAFQALGEARATGGVFGFYGVLEARDGRLDLARVGSIDEFGRTAKSRPVPAPKWFAQSYGPQFALRQPLQVNTSPSFPTASEVLLRMYEASFGEELDGVLAMDPVTLEQLMPATGPVTPVGSDITVGAENVRQVLMEESYLVFETPTEQDVFLAGLVRAFWDSLRSGDVDVARLGEGIGEAAATQHLMVYARDGEVQSKMSELEVTADFARAGEHVQMVFGNNYGANKVDYFLHRSIQTRVDLNFDGAARVRTTTELRNDAPAGPPSLLLGPSEGKDIPPGHNRSLLAVLVPKGARVHSYTEQGEPEAAFPFVYSDRGHPVAWDVVDVPPGETRTVTVEYFVTDAARLVGGEGIFELTLWPQPAANADLYEIVVTAAEGFTVSADGEGGTRGRAGHASGVLDREQNLRFTIEATASR